MNREGVWSGNTNESRSSVDNGNRCRPARSMMVIVVIDNAAITNIRMIVQSHDDGAGKTRLNPMDTPAAMASGANVSDHFKNLPARSLLCQPWSLASAHAVVVPRPFICTTSDIGFGKQSRQPEELH